MAREHDERADAGQPPEERLGRAVRSVVVTEPMSEKMTSWHPGEIAPASGIYECDCGRGREHHWRTGVKGHRFPPLPSGYSGESWKLQKSAHPENYLG